MTQDIGHAVIVKIITGTLDSLQCDVYFPKLT